MTKMPMTTYNNEPMSLTERERKFARAVILKAVYELKECLRREARVEEFEGDVYKDMPAMRERSIGYGYGQRNAARDIAGSSLSDLFGGMGIDTINALEALALRDDIHTHDTTIVDDYYEELLKQWGR